MRHAGTISTFKNLPWAPRAQRTACSTLYSLGAQELFTWNLIASSPAVPAPNLPVDRDRAAAEPPTAFNARDAVGIPLCRMGTNNAADARATPDRHQTIARVSPVTRLTTLWVRAAAVSIASSGRKSPNVVCSVCALMDFSPRCRMAGEATAPVLRARIPSYHRLGRVRRLGKTSAFPSAILSVCCQTVPNLAAAVDQASLVST